MLFTNLVALADGSFDIFILVLFYFVLGY